MSQGEQATAGPPPRASITGQALLLECAALLALVAWMYLNAHAGSGGGVLSNGGLFFVQPRPPSAAEILTHQRLTIAVVALPVLALGVAAWRRRWILAAAHLPVVALMVRVASALTPHAA